MEVSTTEIAENVFRISVYPPGAPISFGCFLIRDDEPTMVETGMRGMFEPIYGAVKSLIDPSKLRHLVVPHFEMDECGSINRFLELAPNAQPVASPMGAQVTLPDFCDRPAYIIGNGETLQIGQKTLSAVAAPWVHYWDSMLVYDQTDQVLFTSDLFMQPGNRAPIISDDLSGEIIGFCRYTGLLPSQRHLEAVLDRIEPLAVDTIACHHGSVLTGDPHRYYRAFRENVVGDVVDAPFYEERGASAAP